MLKNKVGAEKKVKTFSLEQLRQVEEILGNRDRGSSHRTAINNQIKRLEKEEQRWYESIIWASQIPVYIGIAVVASVITYYIIKV